jgi:hypothetical protein
VKDNNLPESAIIITIAREDILFNHFTGTKLESGDSPAIGWLKMAYATGKGFAVFDFKEFCPWLLLNSNLC